MTRAQDRETAVPSGAVETVRVDIIEKKATVWQLLERTAKFLTPITLMITIYAYCEDREQAEEKSRDEADRFRLSQEALEKQVVELRRRANQAEKWGKEESKDRLYSIIGAGHLDGDSLKSVLERLSEKDPAFYALGMSGRKLDDLDLSSPLASADQNSWAQRWLDAIRPRQSPELPEDEHDTRSGSASDQEDTPQVLSLRWARFAGSYLNRANFSGSDLGNVDFKYADLRDANFAGSILSGAKFTNANVTGANFSGADLSLTGLTEEQLASAAGDQGTVLPAGKVRPAHWSKTDLLRALRAEPISNAEIHDRLQEEWTTQKEWIDQNQLEWHFVPRRRHEFILSPGVSSIVASSNGRDLVPNERVQAFAFGARMYWNDPEGPWEDRSQEGSQGKYGRGDRLGLGVSVSTHEWGAGNADFRLVRAVVEGEWGVFWDLNHSWTLGVAAVPGIGYMRGKNSNRADVRPGSFDAPLVRLGGRGYAYHDPADWGGVFLGLEVGYSADFGFRSSNNRAIVQDLVGSVYLGWRF